MSKRIGLFLALGLCVWGGGVAANAADESITISTYYPSPYGVYQNLRIFPTDACPAAPNNCTTANSGLIVYSGSFAGECPAGSGVTIELETMYYCNGQEWTPMAGGTLREDIEVGSFTRTSQFDIPNSSNEWETIDFWSVAISALPCGALAGKRDQRLVIDSSANADCGRNIERGYYWVEWGGTVGVAQDSSHPIRHLQVKVDKGGCETCFSNIDMSQQFEDSSPSSFPPSPAALLPGDFEEHPFTREKNIYINHLFAGSLTRYFFRMQIKKDGLGGAIRGYIKDAYLRVIRDYPTS